jgi:hypothetical protein
MDESLRAQIDAYVRHLAGLIQRGRQLGGALTADSSDVSAIAATRVWQQDCGVVVNQLSGGSKAHWLARSYSEAFLMRSADGGVIETVAPSEIVNRLVAVLERAVTSLSQLDERAAVPESSEATALAGPWPRRRFEFVHNSELRPVLEQAYSDSRRALEQGRYSESLLTSCGVLEAIVTDALENSNGAALISADAPAGRVADWSFEKRLAVAEKAGIIHNGCARLPGIARRYRELADIELGETLAVSERDARQVRQVLHVVMRDLDPGR